MKEAEVNATRLGQLVGQKLVSRQQYDQVFYEAGTDANDELYVQLRPYSRNDGVIDVEALARGNVVLPGDHDGLFTLVRVGDAVSSRSLHAALFDALRICARIDLSSLTRIDAP